MLSTSPVKSLTISKVLSARFFRNVCEFPTKESALYFIEQIPELKTKLQEGNEQLVSNLNPISTTFAGHDSKFSTQRAKFIESLEKKKELLQAEKDKAKLVQTKMEHEENVHSKLEHEDNPKIIDTVDAQLSDAFSKICPSNIKDKAILCRIEKFKAEVKAILASL